MRLSTYKSKPKRIYILVLLLLERWAQSEESERSKNHKQNTPHFFSRSSFGYMKGGMEWIGFWNQIGSALDANRANSVGDDVNSEDEAKNIFKWKIIMEKKKKNEQRKRANRIFIWGWPFAVCLCHWKWFIWLVVRSNRKVGALHFRFLLVGNPIKRPNRCAAYVYTKFSCVTEPFGWLPLKLGAVAAELFWFIPMKWHRTTDEQPNMKLSSMGSNRFGGERRMIRPPIAQIFLLRQLWKLDW